MIHDDNVRMKVPLNDGDDADHRLQWKSGGVPSFSVFYVATDRERRERMRWTRYTILCGRASIGLMLKDEL